MSKKSGKSGEKRGGGSLAARVRKGAAFNGIGTAEYASRRARVLDALDGAVGLVYAGDGAAPLLGRWTPAAHFAYLTGITDEPGAVLMFDPRSEDARRRVILFLRSSDPELEAWDGLRERIGSSLRIRYGIETVMRLRMLPRMLTSAARRRKRLACLHGVSLPDAPVSPDLAMFRRIGERAVGVSIEDRTELLPAMRSVKSRDEVVCIERAASASAAGYRAALRVIRPGAGEDDVARALVRGFQDAGGDGVGYNPIVGSGLNSTVLHYMDNRQELVSGDVLLIDAASSWRGYCADITRTYPVDGRFTKRQREIYELVLEAQMAAIDAVRPGAGVWDVDRAARKVIDKAGFADAFMHGTGHHLGMEVHDAEPDGVLAPGNVITIEPGVYLPDERLGVRIEDDILVTEKGRRNLTESVTKDAKEIERLMRDR